MTMRSCVMRSALCAALAAPAVCLAGSEPFIGEITCGAWTFAPLGTMEMAGQLLPISQFEALFALVGTTYGGDGEATFQLPDMRGRAIMVAGQGPGLSPRQLGEFGGTETVTLFSSQLPLHSHSFSPPASISDASALTPAGAMAATKARTPLYAPGPGGVPMVGVVSAPAGSGQPFERRQPYLALMCVIAVEGIFPSQN